MEPSNLVFLAIIAAFVVLRLRLGFRTAGQIQEAKDALAQGGLLVDVRSPGEYASGHANGAVNVPSPPGTLAKEKKDRALVVYCASGARSAAATRTLKASGFTTIYNVGTLGNARKVSG